MVGGGQMEAGVPGLGEGFGCCSRGEDLEGSVQRRDVI